jgi:ATP/maltotriose-dependent transcriptional regulator MalT
VLRTRLISRPRLIEQFDAGLRCKLAPISAPASFGKTTRAKVAQWGAD